MTDRIGSRERLRMRYALSFSLFLVIASCSGQSQGEVSSLGDFRDSLSYSIGMDIGTSLFMQDISIDPVILGQAVRDSYTGRSQLLTEAEMENVLTTFQQQETIRLQDEVMAQAQINRRIGAQYMEENSAEDGVFTTPSGLQYRVVERGSGPTPSSTDTVEVHYQGELLDGTIFDSSYARGSPATFVVSQVIAGWTEALQLMSTGSKWELLIPADLAYGDPGYGSIIPPGSTLRFEVELLSIQ
ncbi:FKBP-type peptidyl-prolyl cis-trans isomerase [Candidatus Neomarinimicrobiota bacterium]